MRNDVGWKIEWNEQNSSEESMNNSDKNLTKQMERLPESTCYGYAELYVQIYAADEQKIAAIDSDNPDWDWKNKRMKIDFVQNNFWTILNYFDVIF